MNITTVTAARKNLFKLVEDIATSSEVMRIKGKKGDVVMISAADWDDIAETLFLESIPGMANSIIQGGKEPLDDCVKELNW